MPPVFRMPIEVQQEHIDLLGHVHNLQYLEWMQDAAIKHSALQGWDIRRYREIGAVWVVRRHEIEYRSPAKLGEQLEVVTWVSEFRKIRSLRRYEIWRSGSARPLALGSTDWTFVDIRTGGVRKVPDEVRDAFDVIESYQSVKS